MDRLLALRRANNYTTHTRENLALRRASSYIQKSVGLDQMLEYRNGYVAINPRFTKLTTTLRTAVEKGDGTLDKEMTSHDDLFDSFRLSLQFWHV
jgi:hypothetical protein